MSPTLRTLAWLCGWLMLGVAASWLPALTPVWQAAGVLLAGAIALDAARAFRAPRPQPERQLPRALSMGVWTPVHVRLENPHTAPVRLRCFDHHPARARVEGLPLTLEVPAQTAIECTYRLRPEQRGQHHFGPLELRVRSPWGLLERHLRVDADASLRAYPNFRAAVGYDLLASANRTGVLGIRRRPRRGEGLEFHQLRDYRAGDPLRQIDWKATARLSRTISREYQEERDQRIVFLLDCGRRLHAKDGERSHFDAALDALLLAAHVALRQGDAVGLMTFSGERRWITPRKGVAQLSAIVNAVYDLESSPRAADYRAAARDLAARVTKRALVVLISNVRDEDTDELRACLRLLSRRHLVLLASLSESVLGETLRAPIEGLDDALRVASVHRYLGERQSALQQLARCGALLLDSEPDALPVALVNGYLDVKAAGVL